MTDRNIEFHLGRNPILSYSIRRRLVDQGLADVQHRLCGCVLDVGGVKVHRRGRFVPPSSQVAKWITLNIEPSVQPDVLADAKAIPLSDNSIDVVLMIEVIEYLSQPGQALEEVARVLREGGQFIATIPFMHRFDSPHDYQRFSVNKIAQLLCDAGLYAERVEPQGGYFAVLADMIQRPLSRVPEALIRLPLAILILPLIHLLLWIDTWHRVRHSPFLSSYSTGYLVVASKAKTREQVSDSSEL